MLDLAHVENYMQKLVVRLVSASYCKQHQNTMRAAREKTYKQRQHPCSSEDGNVCNNVSKIYQDACSSGSEGGVERFKIFKKGWCSMWPHREKKHSTYIKRFPKGGSKRTSERGNCSPVVFFCCSRITLTRPLAQTHTECVHAACTCIHFMWVSKCLSIAHKLKRRTNH